MVLGVVVVALPLLLVLQEAPCRVLRNMERSSTGSVVAENVCLGETVWTEDVGWPASVHPA